MRLYRLLIHSLPTVSSPVQAAHEQVDGVRNDRDARGEHRSSSVHTAYDNLSLQAQAEVEHVVACMPSELEAVMRQEAVDGWSLVYTEVDESVPGGILACFGRNVTNTTAQRQLQRGSSPSTDWMEVEAPSSAPTRSERNSAPLWMTREDWRSRLSMALAGLLIIKGISTFGITIVVLVLPIWIFVFFIQQEMMARRKDDRIHAAWVREREREQSAAATQDDDRSAPIG